MNIWYHWVWHIFSFIVLSFADFISLFRVLPFPSSEFVLNLPLPQSPALLSTCIFQSSHLPISILLLFSLHLFLLLYFFLNLFYRCSALGSTSVLPLLLALTLPVLLFLPLPFVLVMSLSWCLPCFAPVFPHPYRYYWLFSLPLTCFLPFFT